MWYKSMLNISFNTLKISFFFTFKDTNGNLIVFWNCAVGRTSVVLGILNKAGNVCRVV